MKSIYTSFDDVKQEANKWQSITNDDNLIKDIRENQIPALKKIFKKISAIKSDSQEIIHLKKKYQMGIKLHIDGYNFIAKGVDELQQETIKKGMGMVG